MTDLLALMHSQSLADKRALLLNTLYTAYGEEWRSKKATALRKVKIEKAPDVLVKTAVTSGVNVMLSILDVRSFRQCDCLAMINH
jgi:hypothetical protein